MGGVEGVGRKVEGRGVLYQAGYDDIIKIPHDALKKYLFVPCLVMTCAYGGGGGG